MRMPKPRGPLSEWVVARLAEPGRRRRVRAAGRLVGRRVRSRCGRSTSCPTAGSRTRRTTPSGSPRCWWSATSSRSPLEQRLRARWPGAACAEAADVPAALEALVAADDGPSLADHVRRRATATRCSSCCASARSTTSRSPTRRRGWCPRLPVRAKAALVELQFDEYGDGDPNRLHSHLFARGHGGGRPAPGVRRLRRRRAARDPRDEQRRSPCSACSAGCAARRWVTWLRSR